MSTENRAALYGQGFPEPDTYRASVILGGTRCRCGRPGTVAAPAVLRVWHPQEDRMRFGDWIAACSECAERIDQAAQLLARP